MVEFGQTRRGWLGVFIQEVTPDIAGVSGFESSIRSVSVIGAMKTAQRPKVVSNQVM